MLEEFTLLYVEDDKDMQDYMKELLNDEVLELFQAYDGAEGFEYFKEKRPDIIISDINMPILNGLEMSRKIKEISSDQIIILLSSLNDIGIVKESIDINIDGYINKPILDIDTFLNKIYSKVSLLQYKKLKLKEEKMEVLIGIIREISHHWKQPLNVISLITSEYLFKCENNITITNKDIEKFEMITQTVNTLSNTLDQIENMGIDGQNIEGLLEKMRISNPIYK